MSSKASTIPTILKSIAERDAMVVTVKKEAVAELNKRPFLMNETYLEELIDKSGTDATHDYQPSTRTSAAVTTYVRDMAVGDKPASPFVPNSEPGQITIRIKRPEVIVSEEVYNDMRSIVGICPEEVSWLGTVHTSDTMEGLKENQYYIERVFLLEQQVSAATTSMLQEGLSELCMKLMDGVHPSIDQDLPEAERCAIGLDWYNRLKFWGHSHVNMGVSPSGQDDTQMEDFDENGNSFFIRGIFNKKGVSMERENITDVQVDRPFGAQVFCTGKVRVNSAGRSGDEIVMFAQRNPDEIIEWLSA